MYNKTYNNLIFYIFGELKAYDTKPIVTSIFR